MAIARRRSGSAGPGPAHAPGISSTARVRRQVVLEVGIGAVAGDERLEATKGPAVGLVGFLFAPQEVIQGGHLAVGPCRLALEPGIRLVATVNLS